MKDYGEKLRIFVERCFEVERWKVKWWKGSPEQAYQAIYCVITSGVAKSVCHRDRGLPKGNPLPLPNRLRQPSNYLREPLDPIQSFETTTKP